MSEQDIQKYEKMLEEDPGSRAFAPLAEAHRKAGNLDDAIRVAETGLEIHPGYTGGLVVLGRALFEKKELDKAEEVLQKAVTETPESYLGQKFLGKVLMEKGENQAALTALEAAYAQSPDDAEIIELLEKIRPKAQPPEAMVFSGAGEEEDSGDVGIVTYEQKPTTVDGVELEPLPSKVDEETFSFTEVQEVDEYRPMESAVKTEGPAVTDAESIDALGPEAAEFIKEADHVDVSVFDTPGEETIQEETTFTIEDLMVEVEPDQIPGEPGPVSPEPLEVVPEPLLSTAAPQGPMEGAPPSAEDGDDQLQVVQPAPQEPPGFEEIIPSVQEAPHAEEISIERPPVGSVPPADPGILEGALSPLDSPAGNGTGVQSLSQTGPEPDEFIPVNTEDKAGEFPIEPPEVEAAEPAGAGIVETFSAIPEQPGDEIAIEYEEVPPSPQAPPSSAQTSPDHSASAGDISTETLADLYANQGLVEKAAEIYRQILLERPSDEGIMAKLRILEQDKPVQAGVDTRVESGSPAGDISSEDNDDVLNILENWLQNAERMRQE